MLSSLPMKRFRQPVLFLATFVLCAPATGFASESTPMSEDTPLTRSLVSLGNPTRLYQVLQRAEQGEEICVGVIGGSITAGARASQVEYRWGNRVHAWWTAAFPDTSVRFVNAGIGATGSSIGAHRAKKDLLIHHPDVVVVEFSVNDENRKLFAETLEGLVRQILNSPKKPAVLLLFTMNRQGNNAQEWHGQVGEHYRLPMVSFRDAVWPEIQAGRLKWEDVEADEVHPNDRGHALCADYLNHVFEWAWETLPRDRMPCVPPLPDPLFTDVFERTTLLNAEKIAPLSIEGWSSSQSPFFGPCWETDQPGSSLFFELSGSAISVIFYRVKGDMGIARAGVDDLPPVELNGWFAADWGGYSPWELVAGNLSPGPHRVHIELLEKKAPQSQGHRFQLLAVCAAGG